MAENASPFGRVHPSDDCSRDPVLPLFRFHSQLIPQSLRHKFEAPFEPHQDQWHGLTVGTIITT